MIVETAKVEKLRAKKAELAKVDEGILRCVAENGIEGAASSKRFARLCTRRETLMEESGDSSEEVFEECVKALIKERGAALPYPNPTSKQMRQNLDMVGGNARAWARTHMRDAGLWPPGRNPIMDLAMDVKEGRIRPPSEEQIRDMKTARASYERRMQSVKPMKRRATPTREELAA